MKSVMQAVIPDDHSPLLTEVPIPTPGPGQVLIDVHYAGVNRADLMQVKGKYPPPHGVTDILGLEVAGRRTDTGEPVMALLPGGGYAQQCVVSEDHLLPVPDSTSLLQAATIPESLATAWSNLDAIDASPGKTIYIQGGSGSVGVVALQLARERGARVIASAGSAERCEALEQMGVTAINHHDDVASIMADLVPDGVDGVLGIIGTDLDQLMKLTAPGGRIAIFGVQGGIKTEINIFRMMTKRLTITGTALRSRSDEDKTEILKRAWAFAEPRYNDGRIEPVVDSVVDITQVAQAHEWVASRHPFGKVVLDLTSLSRP